MENANSKIYRNRWLILLNVVLLTFMACLDGSIVNVALPIMSEKLRVSMQAIEWVVNSYLIVISAAILIFGRLGDMKGKTLIFKGGILVFTFGSFMCGMSGSLPVLVAARILQAIGASAFMATSQGIITHVFPGNERGRALGISGTFVALGNLAGPPLGGLIVSAFSWKYIFLINVPIGIFTFLMGLKILPKAEINNGEKLDLKGAIFFVSAVVLMFGSLTQAQDSGFSNPVIIMCLIISVISLIIFIFIEKRIEEPLLDLSLFENKLFSLSIFCGFISFVCISCPNIIQPFYLQDVLKLSPYETGMLMMIYPLILSVVAPASGYLSDKIGSEFLTFLGLIFTSLGLLLTSTLNEHSSLFAFGIFVSIMSFGNGLFQSPNNSLVMSTVKKSKLGIAGSVNALIRNLGIVFGTTLATTLLYKGMSHKIGYHVLNYVKGRDDVFVYGMRIVYITAAVICASGAILTAFRMYSNRSKIKADV